MILDDMGLAQAKDGVWRMLRNAWTPAFAPGTLARCARLTCRLHALSRALDACLPSEPGPRPVINDTRASAGRIDTAWSRRDHLRSYYAIMEEVAVELVKHIEALAPWSKAGGAAGTDDAPPGEWLGPARATHVCIAALLGALRGPSSLASHRRRAPLRRAGQPAGWQDSALYDGERRQAPTALPAAAVARRGFSLQAARRALRAAKRAAPATRGPWSRTPPRSRRPWRRRSWALRRRATSTCTTCSTR